MDENVLKELEEYLNSGSVPDYISTGYITKGMVGREKQYKFVVNSNDHKPPHIHISEHNIQIASYDLETGMPIKSNNSRLDTLVVDWLSKEGNQAKALKEWYRFHGGNQ